MKVLSTESAITHFEFRVISAMHELGKENYTPQELADAMCGNYHSTLRTLNNLTKTGYLNKILTERTRVLMFEINKGKMNEYKNFRCNDG